MKVNLNLIRQLSNLIAVFAAFGVNVLANVRPIGDLTLGEISNQLFGEVLITPARYAFAIWGVIYLGLFSFAIYQALPRQRNKLIFQDMSYWLVAASVAQIIWVFIFQFRFFVASFVVMLLILLPLIRLYLKVNLPEKKLSRREQWFIQIPVSIYLGWISVATVVNGAVALTDLGWMGGGISPTIWTVIMMGIAGAIALWIHYWNQDIVFAAVFVWALSAIAVRHQDQLPIFGAGVILTIILASRMLWSLRRANPSKPLS